MKEIYELIAYRNGKQVATQDITGWTTRQVEELWQIEAEDGRECEIKKTFRKNGKEITS